GEGLVDAAGARVEACEVVSGRWELAERPRALEERAGAVDLVRVRGGEAEALELEGIRRRAFEDAHVLDLRRGRAFRGGAARGDPDPGSRGGRGQHRLRAGGERQENGSRERGVECLHPADCKGTRVRTAGE